MNKTEVLLTASLPNYNHGHYLKKRIPSLLQSMPALSELIIVDDASTDDSVEILEYYAAQDSRIKLIKNPKNMGVNYSANIILSQAKGKYIAFLSSDDVTLPDFFTKILEVARSYPEAAICCSDCGLSYEEGWPERNPGEIYTTHLIKDQTQTRFFSKKEILNTFQTTTFWIPCHASIIKLDAILKRGGFNSKFGPHSDWFLLHSIALEEGVAYLPQTLAIWHQSLKSYSTGTQFDRMKMKDIYYQFFLTLSQNENKKLRTLFKKARLLDFYAARIFIRLFFNIKYWDVVFRVGFRALKRRLVSVKKSIF